MSHSGEKPAYDASLLVSATFAGGSVEEVWAAAEARLRSRARAGGTPRQRGGASQQATASGDARRMRQLPQPVECAYEPTTQSRWEQTTEHVALSRRHGEESVRRRAAARASAVGDCADCLDGRFRNASTGATAAALEAAMGRVSARAAKNSFVDAFLHKQAGVLSLSRDDLLGMEPDQRGELLTQLPRAQLLALLDY
eukprot:COSAG01_NODE_12547_length_1722_cov_1.071473_2_plen_198_part_00